MENANLPKSNHIEFSDDTEDDEKIKKIKKAKKSKFAEWLGYLVPTETNSKGEPETSKEPGRTERFLESFKNLFAGFSHVEKQEVEDLSSWNSESNHNTGSKVDISETEVSVSDYVELSEPVPDQADVVGSAKPQEVFGGEPATDQTDTAATENDKLGKYEAPSANLFEENINSLTEQIRNRYYDAADDHASVETPKHVKEIQRETIVEKRGNGAALLGFVAAETLSRSRDKKIRNDAAELREQVQKLDKKQASTELELHNARKQNREQLKELKAKREAFSGSGKNNQAQPAIYGSTEEAKLPNSQSKPHLESAYSIGARRINSTENSPSKHEADKDSTSLKEASTKRPEFLGLPKQEISDKSPLLVQEETISFEQAQEKYTNPEHYYDSRHEVKDTPVRHNTKFVSTNNGSQAPVVSFVDKVSDDKLQELQNKQDNASQLQAMYRQAARQGAGIGLLIVLAALIVMLMMSLL